MMDVRPQGGANSCQGVCQEGTGMEIELRRVVDALPGLVWTARLDGHIDFLNQRWSEYTGLGVEESVGVEEACDRTWRTATHPEDLPGLLERWRSILASGQPDEMEVRLRRFDGEYRWFLFRASSLVDASGRIVKWCGMNTDIDDRKRAEEALHAHERRFRSIVDGFPALVALRTPAGDLEYANRRYL
jgi:PAS domain S-box-containing protein